MKRIKYLALAALALTLSLSSCKKKIEADDSSQYFGTVWQGEIEYDINEYYYGKNVFRYEFLEGKKVIAEAAAYKITKAMSSELVEQTKASGSFSAKGNKIKVVLEKPIVGYESADQFPVIFEGTVSGNYMTLKLEGSAVSLNKVTPPEV